MLRLITPIIGLIILALGFVVLFEGSQEIAGIAIISVSAVIILAGIGLLLLKKKPNTSKAAPEKTESPKPAEPEEDPPAF